MVSIHFIILQNIFKLLTINTENKNSSALNRRADTDSGKQGAMHGKYDTHRYW